MQKLLDKLGFDKKTFMRFLLISSNSQLIYAFINIRSVLYDPFLEVLNVSNTEFGILMGFVGFITTFGGISIGWLQDRFSIRNLGPHHVLVARMPLLDEKHILHLLWL